ncbi:MAG: hypothetical protein NTU61_01575 [Candidatus Altiarchaeota archaeon]|nr:hypothetical protein [Candidatus Altiarchaeota archaeon]
MKKIVLCILVLSLIAQYVSAQVIVDSVSVEPSYVEAGNDVDINVKFHESLQKRDLFSAPAGGTGKSPTINDQNVFYIVKLVPNDEISSRYVIIKDGEKKVGHMFKGESWTTPFKIKVSDDAPVTSYSLEFQVYETNAEYQAPSLSRTYDFNVTINGVVQFIVSSDDQARAGEKAAFNVQLVNVGGGIARHVSVSANASSPLTILGSNEVYVGDISDSDPRNISFTLYVDSVASPKAYEIPVTVSSVDRYGSKQTMTRMLGVKVGGSPKVEASLDKQDDFKSGSTGKLTLSVANTAFVDAKFLSIQILDTKDYTVTSKTDAYIGNLASDDFQSEEFSVKVADGVNGKIPLKVKITYTEENNNIVHVEEPQVFLNVMPDSEYYMKHPQTNGTQTLMMVVILVPGLVFAYLALWLLLKIVGVITTFIDKRVFKR